MTDKNDLKVDLCLHMSKDLTESIENLIDSLTKTDQPEIHRFRCSGANTKLPEVTAIVVIRGYNSKVNCPRFHEEIDYLDELTDKDIYEHGICYCGDLDEIPQVREDEFSKNKIYECPYRMSIDDL